jgi:uncharacterized ion transporter superfamily protein YfcC
MNTIRMQNEIHPQARKFSFKMPDTYVLIVSIIVLATLLTHIIPAGKFNEVKSASGQMVVDAKTFHYIPSTPVGIMGLLLAIPEGLIAAGKIILVLFIVGGVFRIIRETNALDLSVYAAVQRFGSSVLLLIPIIVILTGFLGTAGVFISSCLPFIPLGLIIARQMKLDAIFAVAIIFLGSHVGFMASPICPLTTVVAQQIAGLPLYSGLAFRITVTVCLLSITILYISRYAGRVRRDSRNSYLKEFADDSSREGYSAKEAYGLKHAVVLVAFFAAFIFFAYGSKEWNWELPYLGAVLIPVGLLGGLLNKMSPDAMAKTFVKGAQEMIYGGLLIGFASSISVVLTKGNIMHTIIFSLAKPLALVGPTASALGMYLVNAIFSVFVPSGSGQAMIVMPIMAPLADLIGITRQVSVLSYQMGNGLTHIMVPTYGILMGCLGIANVPFEKWLRFVVPLMLLLGIVMAIALVIAVKIHLV